MALGVHALNVSGVIPLLGTSCRSRARAAASGTADNQACTRSHRRALAATNRGACNGTDCCAQSRAAKQTVISSLRCRTTRLAAGVGAAIHVARAKLVEIFSGAR